MFLNLFAPMDKPWGADEQGGYGENSGRYGEFGNTYIVGAVAEHPELTVDAFRLKPFRNACGIHYHRQAVSGGIFDYKALVAVDVVRRRGFRCMDYYNCVGRCGGRSCRRFRNQ